HASPGSRAGADAMNAAVRRAVTPGPRARLVGLLAAAGFAALAAGGPGEGPGSPGPAPRDPAGQLPVPSAARAPAPDVVRQGFPGATADPNDLTKSDTAWEVEWELTHPDNRPRYPPGSVLRIRSAKFMWKDRAGKPQWVTVARMLELAEIYVPYDNGWTAF